jgi:hypothetical protein
MISLDELNYTEPFVFGNTQFNSIVQEHINLSLVLEPATHFNRNPITSNPDSHYTEFDAFIDTDNFSLTNGNVTENTFGQTVVVDQPDIDYVNENGDMTRVDAMYQLYIQSVMTYGCRNNGTKETSAFKLSIQDYNIRNNSNFLNRNQIIIPNETQPGMVDTVIHSYKKYNYVTTITPSKIINIKGVISMLDSTTIFRSPDEDSNTDRIILDFILVPSDLV